MAFAAMLVASILMVKLYLKTFLVGTILCTCCIGLIGSIICLVFANKTLLYFGISEHKDIFGPFASLIVILIGILLGGWLGYKLANTFIFIGVAFFCAYTFVRGISLFLGGFVNEASLVVGVLTDKDIPAFTL